jgi:hypothetical protein
MDPAHREEQDGAHMVNPLRFPAHQRPQLATQRSTHAAKENQLTQRKSKPAISGTDSTARPFVSAIH